MRYLIKTLLQVQDQRVVPGEKPGENEEPRVVGFNLRTETSPMGSFVRAAKISERYPL